MNAIRNQAMDELQEAIDALAEVIDQMPRGMNRLLADVMAAPDQDEELPPDNDWDGLGFVGQFTNGM